MRTQCSARFRDCKDFRPAFISRNRTALRCLAAAPLHVRREGKIESCELESPRSLHEPQAKPEPQHKTMRIAPLRNDTGKLTTSRAQVFPLSARGNSFSPCVHAKPARASGKLRPRWLVENSPLASSTRVSRQSNPQTACGIQPLSLDTMREQHRQQPAAYMHIHTHVHCYLKSATDAGATKQTHAQAR